MAHHKRKRGNDKRVSTSALWNGEKQTAHFIGNKGEFQAKLERQVITEHGEPLPTNYFDCKVCKQLSGFEYSDQYDTHYCLKCGGAFEKKCSDIDCEYCIGRPG